MISSFLSTSDPIEIVAPSFNLSPDGTYMSYREKDANLKNHVYVKDIKTGKVTLVIEEKEELIRGYGWANKDRLLYVMDKGGNEDFHLLTWRLLPPLAVLELPQTL